ncbi:DNA-directed RNA polymerase III subunit RPC8-like [Corticium candelabrum]|uniref:DNA-directed RNA polymerase III subunit RPC8-like n=1 Tax=Corticium candelabrum TaxID=121492 RepID=UPI002E30F275|nr:DNA-directed RNA polymerase III subunit RPC8-like [Corticium candelabrum]XP_062508747.1 DNA-directed RNA polymerase III subunit RPC8-like [Corticium candelabrum]XP_062508748.1 DNA-directed RNA polymerase III subunit RPC8-like [Corticium candelabrum]
MFVLVEMKDTVRIKPHLFGLDRTETISTQLNKKFANKVIHQVGLCIALHDITKIEDSYILPGDGAYHCKVHFRYAVLRPFIDEVIVGKVRSSSPEGVNVSLGFFDDILIPADSLQHPSRFDQSEQVWIWEYQTEDGCHDLYMDVRKGIRFRVAEEIFVDVSPSAPEANEAAEKEKRERESRQSPYTIIGSVSGPGLGLLEWWQS